MALEEKNLEITRLRRLCQFLATEVKVYTSTLEEENRSLKQQVERQRIELARSTDEGTLL